MPAHRRTNQASFGTPPYGVKNFLRAPADARAVCPVWASVALAFARLPDRLRVVAIRHQAAALLLVVITAAAVLRLAVRECIDHGILSSLKMGNYGKHASRFSSLSRHSPRSQASLDFGSLFAQKSANLSP